MNLSHPTSRSWRVATGAVVALGLAAGYAVGCQRGEATVPEPSVVVAVCMPGSQVSCGCPGGEVGAQVCDGEGTGYGPCDHCAPPGEAPAVAPTGSAYAGDGDDDDFGVPDLTSSAAPTPSYAATAQPAVHVPSLPTSVPLTPMAPGVDCTQTQRCRSWGYCTPSYGGCALTSTADCKRTDGCTRHGSCTYHPGGRRGCGPSSDAECQASDDCRERGKCTLRDGWCTAAKPADCAATELCTRLGLCGVREGECAVATTADCLRADACTQGGFCRAQGGVCVK